MQPSIRKLKVFEKTKITITKTTKTLEKEEQRLQCMKTKMINDSK